MNTRFYKTAFVASLIVTSISISGCEGTAENSVLKKDVITPEIKLGTTIGQVAEVFYLGASDVQGYALVGGLRGTGSSECPSQVREYLEKYIRKQLTVDTNIEQFISSHNTAVVTVYGTMPPIPSKNQRFDIKIAAVGLSKTTSLEGGVLLGAELFEPGRVGTMHVLATAQGPVFIDRLDRSGINKKLGYILGGGKVVNDCKIHLALRQPSYRISNQIRNRLNELFDPDTAKANSASIVELKIPAKYEEQKERFLSIVKTTYLIEDNELIEDRLTTFSGKLAVSEDKYSSEIALESLGNRSVSKLTALLNSFNQEVRFRSARCLLNLGSNSGFDTLRSIALEKNSPYRIEALNAITSAATRNDAVSVSRSLLKDEDFAIRLAGYESLRKLEDISITQSQVGGNFYLEQLVQPRYKSVFVYRSRQPRIVLFGAPIYCEDNIFIQSEDSTITINAASGAKEVTIMRKLENIPVISLKCSFELSDIVRSLCESAVVESGKRPGLNVPYDQAISLLKQMCDKGAVKAEFLAGPLPKIPPIVKKQQAFDR